MVNLILRICINPFHFIFITKVHDDNEMEQVESRSDDATHSAFKTKVNEPMLIYYLSYMFQQIGIFKTQKNVCSLLKIGTSFWFGKFLW